MLIAASLADIMAVVAYKYDLVASSIIFSNIESLLSEILLRSSARCLRKGPLHPIIWIIHATRLFPSFSAARKVSNAFFYPDTCPWFIELSHSAIQLHSQPSVAFLSLKTITFLSQTEKESKQRRTKWDRVARLSCGQTRCPQQLFFFKSGYCMWSKTISTTIFKSGYSNGF